MTVLLDFPAKLEVLNDSPILPCQLEFVQTAKYHFVVPNIPLHLLDVVLVGSGKSTAIAWLLRNPLFKGLIYATGPVIENIRVSLRELMEVTEYAEFQSGFDQTHRLMFLDRLDDFDSISFDKIMSIRHFEIIV